MKKFLPNENCLRKINRKLEPRKAKKQKKKKKIGGGAEEHILFRKTTNVKKRIY